MNCTRCDGTGFINLEQIQGEDLAAIEVAPCFTTAVQEWMKRNASDVAICDCCGDGTGWYGEPGVHDESQYGKNGPYAYNGGLPECW